MLFSFTSDKKKSEQTTDQNEEWLSPAGDTIIV